MIKQTLSAPALALALALALTLAACQSPHQGQHAQSVFGLSPDGGCVTRPVLVLDPDTGEAREVTQRFCGNRVHVVR